MSGVILDIPSNLSTIALEQKAKQLQEQASKHGQTLTQKLASSQSGQNLLHMGSRLRTLPPDLHSLLTNLHPVQASAEKTEEKQLKSLNELVEQATTIRLINRRVHNAEECSNAYVDLLAAENAVQTDLQIRRKDTNEVSLMGENCDETKEDEFGKPPTEFAAISRCCFLNCESFCFNR